MHNQRKLPSKRYSSYMPSTEFSGLEDDVPVIPPNSSHSEHDVVNMRKTTGMSSPERAARRKSHTLHFDALQNAVSKLSRIDDYDLEELGYGFFSDVFKVTHKQSGKIMVLKRNKDTNTKLNILREVQLMNRLSHPNILKFLGVCVHEGQLHALTEFINGGDLDQLVQQFNICLSWAVRIRLALDVARGLAYLHSMGIFHRDLTAKNCLVRVTTTLRQKKKYSAVVADLGLAEKIPTTPEQKAKMHVVGTPYCMAPEVLTSKPYDERSDFFSFGMILSQLMIRTSSDPEKLPRSDDFGLKRDFFYILVKKGVGAPELSTRTLPLSMPPNGLLQLAYDCCEVDPNVRPNISEIVCRLEQTLNEEKQRRIERKKQLSLNVEDTTQKRHSTPLLSDLSPITNLVQDTQSSSAKCALSTDHDKENTSLAQTSTVTANNRRSSGSGIYARLSRSSSDVSNELISHAASIIAASQKSFSDGMEEQEDMSSVVDSLNEAFINPFSALEKSELQEQKLFDLPSSEVLEMTFDLPAPKSSSGSPSRFRKTPTRLTRRRHTQHRPKSLLLDLDARELPHLMGNLLSPRVKTPEPLSEIPNFSQLCGNTSTGSDSSGTVTPQPAPFSAAEIIAQQDSIPIRLQKKHALIRSVAFSPQGRHLLSWWHKHARISDWRSMASVLSIMTDKMGTLKRSISVPDLSQEAGSLVSLSHKTPLSGRSPRTSISSDKGSSPRSSISGKPPSGPRLTPTAYPAYVTLPRKKKGRSKSSSCDPGQKTRSKTTDDVFADESVLEILHEESPDTKQKSTTASPQQCNCTKPPMSPRKEINNNNNTRSILSKRVPGAQIYDPVTSTIPREYPNDESASKDHNGSVSSSSTSSGASSTGLKMVFQTGVHSSSRRKRVGSQPPRLSFEIPLEEYSSCSTQVEDSSVEVLPAFEDSCCTPRSNRDSGYNDDAFSTDHSCDSQSSHETIDSGIRPSRSNPAQGLPDFLSEIAPRCKIRGCGGDPNLTLVGKTH